MEDRILIETLIKKLEPMMLDIVNGIDERLKELPQFESFVLQWSICRYYIIKMHQTDPELLYGSMDYMITELDLLDEEKLDEEVTN